MITIERFNVPEYGMIVQFSLSVLVQMRMSDSYKKQQQDYVWYIAMNYAYDT